MSVREKRQARKEQKAGGAWLQVETRSPFPRILAAKTWEQWTGDRRTRIAACLCAHRHCNIKRFREN
jgi:hypothetical protein